MPYDNVYSEKRTPGALRTVWRNFYGDTTAMIGFYGCIGLVLLCVLGSWFAPYGIDQQFLGYQLLPPSWSRYGEVSFFLGTDDLGRDVPTTKPRRVDPTDHGDRDGSVLAHHQFGGSGDLVDDRHLGHRF